MCLIAFAWRSHPRWRLLLAGNRDEFHARPSEPLAYWDDGGPVIGGRDLEAGGTWLGVTRDGRCCTVTNVRDPGGSQRGLSRGLLVVDYLRGHLDAAGHADTLLGSASAYRPFNLLSFDDAQAYYLGNRPAPRKQRVSEGIHGLSNGDFNAPWPKTRRLMTALRAWIDDGGDEDFEPLFAALADETRPPDGELPDTGVGLDLERMLSPAFIRGERYGSRASTVVALAHDGGGMIVERSFGPNGVPLGETHLEL